MTESIRIADQLRRAFARDPWHGPPLSELLHGITAGEACTRPLPGAHNIWELVLHIEIWANAALEAARGVAMPKLYGTEKDWATVSRGTDAEWRDAVAHLQQLAQQLAQAIETFDDARLNDIVPGREYDFYYLFHGIVQHSLYHGGQIAMLKRAVKQ
jgi:hypothetical protein